VSACPDNCTSYIQTRQHDGAAGTDDGFGYRILYLAPELVRDALAGHALPFVADPVQELSPAARPIASLLADIDEPISELSSAGIAVAVADGLVSLSRRTERCRSTVDIRAVSLVRDYLSAHAREQTPATILEAESTLLREALKANSRIRLISRIRGSGP
jgi:hypothetical protein